MAIKRNKDAEQAHKVEFVGNGLSKHLKDGEVHVILRDQAERLEAKGYGEIRTGKKK
jgi:hypothetical protein